MKLLFSKLKAKQTIRSINRLAAQLEDCSNEELIAQTAQLKAAMAAKLVRFTREIAAKQQTIAENYRKDPLAAEKARLAIRKVENKKRKEEEKILTRNLPQAFAIVKETMRRFANETVILIDKAVDIRDTLFALQDTTLQVVEAEKYLEIPTAWSVSDKLLIWDMIPYDVQLEAAIHLHHGRLIEMGNGEGKTLAAVFPAYLNALVGRKVHILTANVYLAKRDAEWMAPILSFHGLSVATTQKTRPNSAPRIRAYRADVMYSEVNEIGFDYLRDNMATAADDMVNNSFDYVIVDEVDAILIDEARTPLIISGPTTDETKILEEYQRLMPSAQRLVHLARTEANKLLQQAEQAVAQDDLDAATVALLTIELFLPKFRPAIRFRGYNNLNGRIRVLRQELESSSKWSEIRAQLLFTNENNTIQLTERGQQEFAKLVGELAFWALPDLTKEVAAIEAAGIGFHEEKKRKEAALKAYQYKEACHRVVTNLLKAILVIERGSNYEVIDGQVVLIDQNTGRFQDGRRYSDGLHQALEAIEGVTIQSLTQTLATITLQGLLKRYQKIAGMSGTVETCSRELKNIYGLDTVIIPSSFPKKREDLSDQVLRTLREKVNAVVEEVIRLQANGRPVLLCVTDEIVAGKYSRMLSLRGVEHAVLTAAHHQREAEIIAEAGRPGSVVITAKMAGRGTDIKLTQAAIDNGGLAVVVASRNDSRRLDRQLQGRAGRKGLPGSAQFFISLEDSLMLLFKAARISNMMDAMGHDEGEIIESRMVDRSIRRAQRKVSKNAEGVRSRLYQYDNFLHASRETIYTRRLNALNRHRIYLDVRIMFENVCERLVQQYVNDFEEFCLHFRYLFGYSMPFSQKEFKHKDFYFQLFLYTYDQVYLEKVNATNQRLLPIVLKVRKNDGMRYRRIQLPIQSRGKSFNCTADIESAINSEAGTAIWEDVERNIMITILDEQWKTFLQKTDRLKGEVKGKEGEGEFDPLRLFGLAIGSEEKKLIKELEEETVSYLAQAQIIFTDDKKEAPQETPEQEDDAENHPPESLNERLGKAAAAAAGVGRERKSTTFRRENKRISRNDPCPCGSGKLYKRCHGK